jgi:hypothetical protein
MCPVRAALSRFTLALASVTLAESREMKSFSNYVFKRMRPDPGVDWPSRFGTNAEFDMRTSPDTQALSQHLQELEASLLLPDIRKSERLVDLLADNFVEFGSSGRTYTKADLVATLQAESPVTQSPDDFRVEFLAPTVALLTYRICRHSAPPVHTLRSSIWQLHDSQWRMVFHQATLTSAAGDPIR